MFSLNKALQMLSQEQKKYLIFILIMSLISMLLESLSIGVILPLFSILLKGEIGSNYFSTFFNFWDPGFPNSFRKNRSHMAPQGKPLCGKESHMDPLHFRFSSKSVENIGFYKSDSTFS